MAMPSVGRQQIRVADVIDHAKVGALQVGLFILCAMCLILDGFDVQVVGYVAPTIFQEWQVPRAALGNVLAAGNFGVLVGSLVFTMVADKVGRRPVLLGATVFFSILTLLTTRVTSVSELTLIRFIAGVGLGCIIPNATALIGEYSPRRLRVAFMACISVGFTAGAAVAGFVSAWMIPVFGWRSVFYFGGMTPLVIAVLMFLWLPESLQFLVVRRKNLDKVGHWLRRIDPTVAIGPTTDYVVDEESKGGVPAVHLFREGRGAATILLWVINFMNIYNLYLLSGWLPTVINQLGYSAQTGVWVGTTLQVGGTLGTFWLTWVIGRLGFIPVLTTCFVVACASIASIGQPGLALWILFTVVFVAGTCVVGGQPMINSMAALYYPTYVRSTGIGWGLGVGRAGGIVGPWLVGYFISLNWSVRDIFLAAAIPPLVSAAAMFSLLWVMKPAASSAPAEITAH
jgi:AAHS family 4-hydroxybenzoate transporter-like MFS transporter